MRVAVVGSPPYESHVIRARDIGKPGFVQGATQGQHSCDAYGDSPGQLGALPSGTLDARPVPVTPAPVTTWQGCYGDSWQDLIGPESFAHPAKFSRGLIHRIYRHMLEQGYITEGSTILDPFGGVALGALDAMTYGLRYLGVELEPKFVELGNKNLALWRQRYGFTGSTIVQGDSRRLREVLAGAQVQAVVGSPPYAESLHSEQNGIDRQKSRTPGGTRISRGAPPETSYGTTPGQLGAMSPGAVVSRNIASTKNHDRINHTVLSDSKEDACQPVRTAELLSHVEVDGVSHAVESTLAQRSKDAQSQQDMEPRLPLLATISPCRTVGASRTHNGQAADLPGEAMHGTSSGALPLSVTNSPACNAAALSACKSIISSIKTQRAVCGITNSITWKRSVQDATLGTTEESSSWRVVPFVEPGLRELPERKPALMPAGLKLEDVRPGHTTVCTREPLSVLPVALPCPTEANGINTVLMPVGAQQRTLSDAPNEPSTFWSASAQIMQELALLLPAGAVCAWVLKNYVSKGKIVPFPEQWQALCEAHGFVLVEEIHASLVEDHGTQEGLFGDSTQVRTEKKSFFRRLAEKKGSPRIDHETVLIVRKAGSGAGMCCVSSPPFAESLSASAGIDKAERQRVALALGKTQAEVTPADLAHAQQSTYGTTPGNLGNMAVGMCVVSSPPFAGCLSGTEQPEKLAGLALNTDGSNRLSRSARSDTYGTTPGNLGNMPVERR